MEDNHQLWNSFSCFMLFASTFISLTHFCQAGQTQKTSPAHLLGVSAREGKAPISVSCTIPAYSFSISKMDLNAASRQVHCQAAPEVAMTLFLWHTCPTLCKALRSFSDFSYCLVSSFSCSRTRKGKKQRILLTVNPARSQDQASYQQKSSR